MLPTLAPCDRRFGLQAAHLEDQLRVAVVEDADLRVGRLAVVDVAEAAADADHRRSAASFLPRPQRALSISWMPWLPRSPLP